MNQFFRSKVRLKIQFKNKFIFSGPIYSLPPLPQFDSYFIQRVSIGKGCQVTLNQVFTVKFGYNDVSGTSTFTSLYPYKESYMIGIANLLYTWFLVQFMLIEAKSYHTFYSTLALFSQFLSKIAIDYSPWHASFYPKVLLLKVKPFVMVPM